MEAVEKLILAETAVTDEDILSTIAERPGVLGERNKDGRTVLQLLLATKRGTLVERLATAADPDGGDLAVTNADEAGWTALHQVASLGLASLLPIVLPAGVNAPTQSGQTALHYAASKGHQRVVAELLKTADIDPTLPDKMGQTALHRAASLGRVEIVTLLLAHTPSLVNRQDVEGNTALHLAAQEGQPATSRLLLECGADRNLRNTLGQLAEDLNRP